MVGVCPEGPRRCRLGFFGARHPLQNCGLQLKQGKQGAGSSHRERLQAALHRCEHRQSEASARILHRDGRCYAGAQTPNDGRPAGDRRSHIEKSVGMMTRRRRRKDTCFNLQ